jgi:hypothetical protein
VLAGERAIWAAQLPNGGTAVRTSAPGGGRAVLASFDPPTLGGNGSLLPYLSASQSRVAVWLRVSDHHGPVATEAFAGPLGGEFEQLSRCGDSSFLRDLRRVDVSGEAVVLARCRDGRYEWLVRDYAGPVPVEQPLPGQPSGGLRIAGRHVAALEERTPDTPNGIAVYDRITARVVYRVPAARTPHGIHSFALQSDGKVAFTYATDTELKVAWASPSEPVPHDVPLPRGPVYQLQLAGDRIAYQAGNPDGPGEVGVSDLAGRRRTVAVDGEGGYLAEAFDFDGERIAWWSYGCTTARIHVALVAARRSAPRPRSGCRLRFTRRPPPVTSGTARLYVDCFGFTDRQCSARRVVLTARADGRRVVVGRGERARQVRLTAVGRRLLGDRRAVRARARAVLTDAAGRREPRSGLLTLRAGD